MSWFNTSFNASSFNASSFTSLAKSAINKAQKSIDKVLDISEENAASASGKELSKGDPQGMMCLIVVELDPGYTDMFSFENKNMVVSPLDSCSQGNNENDHVNVNI